MEDAAHAKSKTCDIIMKGGITSGVVYPQTILKLSEEYRFRSIGGTSVGAIAAVLTAAAELNRERGGFDVLSSIPREIGEHGKLESLFQPAPSVRPIFSAAKAASESRLLGALGHILRGYWLYFTSALLIAAVLAWTAWPKPFAAVLLFLTALVTGLVIIAAVVAIQLVRALTSLEFGCCPGRTQPGNREPALCDWLADKIEISAGRMIGGQRPQRPLTFGDLWAKPPAIGEKSPAIDLRMMTTNLSLRRPNTLPYLDGNHYFLEAEFRRLFPDWIVDYLVIAAKEAEAEEQAKRDTSGLRPPEFLKFPSGARLPLVVAARMSLSFPILFTTVPLYRVDHAHEDKKMQRMLFSDGGLSSNFPMHFFDALLPDRPTFGVSFGEFDETERDGTEQPRRVRLPQKAREGIGLYSATINSLLDFLTGLVFAAKDWQDGLQATLPGYRERIATVYLSPKEGGLNLTMPPKLINDLIEYGRRAGALLASRPLVDSNDSPVYPQDQTAFEFDEHRWRRFLVAFARIEETLETAAKSWGDASQTTSFAAFIQGYKDNHHSYQSPKGWSDEVFSRFDQVMKLAQAWKEPLRYDGKGRYIPRPESELRITPKP